MNYIKRSMEELILKVSKQYPVIMVCGQRQTGKSTMLRHLSDPSRTYVSFDDPKTRSLAREDPELFFETYGHCLLIDEFQRVPEILLPIKKIVDDAKYEGKNCYGMFWLSGSQKFHMLKSISETLAGRVAILNMLPLSSQEIDERPFFTFSPDLSILKKLPIPNVSLKEYFTKIFNGGLPEFITHPELDRNLYYSSYINHLLERNISSFEHVSKLDEFYSFMVYMARNTACELKYDTISRVVGVSAPTIKEWVTILKRQGIIYILHPYASSVTKRLVKTPKCYFLDTGLAAYLASFTTPETLMNGNACGAFFETYIVSEILKSYYNAGIEPPLYYYRDVDQKEIDLLIVEGDSIYPIEIKKAKSPSQRDIDFTVLSKLGKKVMPGLILCMTDEFFPLSRDTWLCPATIL